MGVGIDYEGAALVTMHLEDETILCHDCGSGHMTKHFKTIKLYTIKA